jgi:hypothetical protein
LAKEFCRKIPPFVVLKSFAEGGASKMGNTQRNKFDVAMELLNLHIELSNRNGKFVSAEELEELFQKYYRLADRLPREV